MSKFMVFDERLYIGDSIKNQNRNKLKRKLVKKSFLSGLFVIVLSEHPENQLDIYDTKQFIQTYFKKKTFHVVGIAGNYSDALQLVKTMAEDCYKQRNDCLIKEYFLCGE